MKYPFTPDVLDALPEELAELFRSLEDTLIEEICSRLKIADNLNEVTVQDIRALKSLGIDLNDIKKIISDISGVSMDRLGKLLDDVVERNQKYYSSLVDLAGIAEPQRYINESDIDAIRRQTKEEFSNITQSMGFLLTEGGRRVKLPPAKAYQWALDNAEMQILSGGISYREAIKSAVKQLADSGIKIVDYESGHTDQVDVAVRRAVMTGVNQVCQRYAEQSVEYLETDLVEVSAHQGARDVGDVPENHKMWQGKVYRWKEKQGNSKGGYPGFIETTGYGTGPGLGGWNCRHHFYPFYEGVSERTYTDEQLSNIDPPPFEYQGRAYTAYEATQQQRKIERTIRKLKRERTAFESAGLSEDAQDISIRIRRLNAEYKSFSKAAGLPEQIERMKVYTKSNTLAKSTKNVILNTKHTNRKISSSLEVVNPMDVGEYNRIKTALEKQGVEVFAAVDGDDLRYMKMIQAEGTYSNGRITHIGEVPSRGTLFEEIIHRTQAVQYGELDSTDFVELCAREVEANRRLLKYQKEYRIDPIDVKEIEENLEKWENDFKRLTGVSYNESDYRRSV